MPTYRPSRRSFIGFLVLALLAAGRGAAPAQIPNQGSAARPLVRSAGPAASVYGVDDRRPVATTARFPWSAIGLVQIYVGRQVYFGTAAMIGPNAALTCGHAVDGSETGPYSAIDFIPGENGGIEPFGRARVLKVIQAPRWAAYGDDGYDMAILILNSPLGEQTGYFEIAVQPDSFFGNASLVSAGYPTDLGSIYPYWVAGRSLGMNGNVILHDLDSEPGQSGSPIWYGGNDSTARLVGVLEGSYFHGGPFGGSVVGIGARIDRQTADWIGQQLAAYADGSSGKPPGEDGSTPTPTPVIRPGSLCGLGSMQVLIGAVLAWTACLISRRRPR